MKEAIKTVKDNSMRLSGFFVAVLLTGMNALTSCSDDELTGNEVVPAKIETGNIIINNDAQELSKQVQLYKKSTLKLRASYSVYNLSMPEQPGIPADAVDIMSNDFQPWAPKGKAFVLKAGDVKSVNSLNLNNAEWYVAGELEVSHYGTGKIYILPGGKVTYKNNPLNSVEIYNYSGTFAPSNDSFTINANSTYMTNGDFSVKQKLNASGVLYVGGNLNVATLDANNGSNIYVSGDATFEQKAQVTNNASMYIKGKLTAPEFEVNSSASVISACGAVFEKKFYLTNGAVFESLSGGYVKSPDTKLDSNCRLFVGSNGFLDLGNLHIPNAPTASIEVTGDNYAVVKASSIKVNNNDLRNTFKGYMGLHYDQIQGDGSQNKIEFLSNIKINEDDNTYIPATDCNLGFGTEPSEPDQKEIIIDHIANVDNPDADHTHDISATCVQMSGDKAYISYHQQGEDYSGCAEVIHFDTPETFSLVSYMRSVESRDFNHLIVDDGKVYLTGGENKGAFMAYIPLTDGIFTSGNADQLNVVRLPGSDANCVVRNGNYYQIATTAGLQTLNASDYSYLGSKETAGSAKFIHLNADKTLTLNLTTRGSDQSGAEVNIYNAADYLFTTPLTTITQSVITPINGKNVSRVDENHVYVCLGNNGFVRYTDGAENGAFKIDNTNAAVNGMDFDDKYIYIAYGSKGLHILDKTTLEEVASYTHSGGKSANYVKVANGYIYVAYGKSGLQVFRLIEK